MNLKLLLEKAAKQYGKKTAIVSGDHRLSYAELDEASNRIANTLIKMGVSRGDRVAMLLPNSPEFAVIYFGIIKVGAIAVPLDTRFRLAELTSLFNNSQPKVLISESPTLEPIVPALPRFKSIEHVIDLSSEYKGESLVIRRLWLPVRHKGLRLSRSLRILLTSAIPRDQLFILEELCSPIRAW